MDERVNILVEAFRRTTGQSLTIEGIFIVVILFSIIIGTLLISYKLKSREVQKDLKKLFINTAKEIGLNNKEIEIIWETAHKLNRDPYLALEVKQTFEKIVDFYIKANPDFDENLIRHMRKILGFDVVPPFLPLTSTKDIDLYQAGKIISDNGNINITLVDKDEIYMYWAVLDPIPIKLEKGDKVEITFIRSEDAVYKIEGNVEDKFKENSHFILKIPHTFHLERTQRRKEIRIKTKLPVKVILDEKVYTNSETEDISVSGLKFCISKTDDEIIKMLKLGENISLVINLKNKSITTDGKIRNIYDEKFKVCFGVEFINLSKEDTSILNEFITNKQMEILKEYKKIKG